VLFLGFPVFFAQRYVYNVLDHSIKGKGG